MFTSATKLERGVENVARKIGIDPKVASKTWNSMSKKFSQSGSKLLKRSNTETPDKYLYNSRIPSHTKIAINSATTKSNITPTNQPTFVKYALSCLIFFACIMLFNFMFAKHLNPSKHTNIQPNEDIYVININNNNSANNNNEIHINFDEGLPALMDNKNKHHSDEMNELFAQISNNNQTTNIDSQNQNAIEENPMLEENSMKQLRDNMQLDPNNNHISSDTDADTDIEIDTESDINQPTESITTDLNIIDKSVFDLKEYKYNPYPMGLSDIDNGIYYLSMIADMDKASKHEKYKWRSYIQHAKLTFRNTIIDDELEQTYELNIEWIAPPFEYDENVKLIKKDKYNESCCYTVILDGYFSEDGRGMELSELIRFDNKLYSFDDRTGIVYEISKQFHAIPRYILMEGNGDISKGMKIEWATYKNNEELLYIGSIGREYTNSDGSKIRQLGLLWVATLDKNGVIKYINWTDKYMKLRHITGTLFPGYLWIEAIEWSQLHRKWFIAPRYVSFDKYDSKLTENKGCNLLIIASEDFNKIELVWIKFKSKKRKENGRQLMNDMMDYSGYKSMNDLNVKELRSMSLRQENIKISLQHSNKGFSSIRFLPNTNDTIIVAIRTSESDKEIINSYLSIFDINGNVYLESKRIPLRKKYEGLVVL